MSGDRFALQLGPGSRRLIPAAQALGPALRADAAAVPQDGRPDPPPDPALRARRTEAAQARQAGSPSRSPRPTTGLTKSFGELNQFFNALAYNPPGSAQEGYLFWLSWLNHNTNALFFTQDAGGPLRHGLVLLNCATAARPPTHAALIRRGPAHAPQVSGVPMATRDRWRQRRLPN